jgi:transcriptional regulator with XRE-family HTH domain
MKDRKSKFYLLLGKNIALHRKQINKNQEELGKSLNLSRATIVNIEKGRHQINAFQVWEIASFLNISVETLLPSINDFLKFEEKPILIPKNLEKEFSLDTIENLLRFIKDI